MTRTSASNQGAVLFAGGGSGGHIFPNLAVIERLREMDATLSPHLLVSHRPLDRQIADDHGMPFAASCVQPFTGKPWKWPAFLWSWRKAVAQARQVIITLNSNTTTIPSSHQNMFTLQSE